MHFLSKTVFMSVLLLIIPSQSASAYESSTVEILTDFSEIDQFENREVGFRVAIKDKEIVQTLTSSGVELYGDVLLVSTRELRNQVSAASDRRLVYKCYNPNLFKP